MKVGPEQQLLLLSYYEYSVRRKSCSMFLELRVYQHVSEYREIGLEEMLPSVFVKSGFSYNTLHCLIVRCSWSVFTNERQKHKPTGYWRRYKRYAKDDGGSAHRRLACHSLLVPEHRPCINFTRVTASRNTITPRTRATKPIPTKPMLVDDCRSSGALSDLLVDDDNFSTLISRTFLYKDNNLA